MKNILPLTRAALRLRFRMHTYGSVGEALSPYEPVGFCCGVQKAGESEPTFSWSGEARIGETQVDQDTIFRVASISKMFGAAAALRLVKRGKLSLDDPAADALGFSTTRPVTLRQLLTHTAALDDSLLYDDVLGEPDQPPLDVLLEKSYLPYELGTQFRYSNLGAGVVGMMVEAASGMLFDDFVRQEFFVPHGIDASFHPQRIAEKDKMANCYRVPGRELAYDAPGIAALPLDTEPNPKMHYHISAGKLMISAPNLLAALQRLAVEDAEMFVRQDHIGSVQGDAGRGLGSATTPKGVFSLTRTLWGHQGVAYGALCEAWIDLTDGTAAVMLTNGVKMRSLGPLYLAGQDGMAALLDQ